LIRRLLSVKLWLMKISKPGLILSSVGLGLTLVFCGQGTNPTPPTKEQQILRQTITGLNNTNPLPNKNQLLADVERLHKEGKISREQLETFKKSINEQYVASSGPTEPDAQAKAQKLLEQKITELNAGQKTALAPSNPEVQGKAQQALQQKLREPQRGVPAQPETGAVAEQALRQKIAELNAAQQPAPPPSAPKAQAKAKPAPKQKLSEPQRVVPAQAETGAVAEQALHQKIADVSAAQKPAPPPSAPKAQAKAKQAAKQKVRDPETGVRAHAETVVVGEQVLHQQTESRTEEKTNFVPEAAGATLTPELEARARELMRLKIAADRNSGSVQPQPNPEAQAKAVAILNQSETELKAGLRPDTAEQTRILRLKIAESRGTITPAEATQAIAGPVTQSAGVNAQLAAVPTRGTPAIGASPVTFQTSNKTGLARLNELTELYKADKITPSEYHHERAKIVATL